MGALATLPNPTHDHGPWHVRFHSTTPTTPRFRTGCLFLLSTVQLTATFRAAGSPAAFGWLLAPFFAMPSLSRPVMTLRWMGGHLIRSVLFPAKLKAPASSCSCRDSSGPHDDARLKVLGWTRVLSIPPLVSDSSPPGSRRQRFRAYTTGVNESSASG